MEKAIEFIKEGLAYCDNTDEKTMKDERMKKMDSKCRETPVE